MDFRWFIHTSCLGQSPVCEPYNEFVWKERTGRHLSHRSAWFGSVCPRLGWAQNVRSFWGTAQKQRKCGSWFLHGANKLLENCLSEYALCIQPWRGLDTQTGIYSLNLFVQGYAKLHCVPTFPDWHPLQGSQNTAPMGGRMCQFIKERCISQKGGNSHDKTDISIWETNHRRAPRIF